MNIRDKLKVSPSNLKEQVSTDQGEITRNLAIQSKTQANSKINDIVNPIFSKTAIVIYEDRPSYEIGIKLLVLSIERHFAQAIVYAFIPNATENFKSWAKHHQIVIYDQPVLKATGVNAKPYALLWALDKGHKQAIWMDSDMILSRPLLRDFLEQPQEVMIASELPGLRKINIHDRTRPWGFEIGRSFQRNPSCCCVWVTQAHRAFIEDWKGLIENPEYQRWQSFPVRERPIYASHEDAVFMALVGSKKYENLAIKLLKCGQDIAQCLTFSSYSVKARLNSLFYGLPPIVHAMGPKPWLVQGSERIYQSLSPYACIAREYQKDLDFQEKDWLKLPEKGISLWYKLVFGHPALASLPFAIKAHLKNFGFRSLARRIRCYINGN
ncbi:hypothetical protein PCC7424_0324 [Gloeothece citriformis PCC 7424]|uniref:Glycosyl transferase family 8 n=1 Tax=Gloeothece citriformis (strain PCC 7424) TaxID=65393 RepID=B7KBW9_GLOC7|nr:hypothetical protein [Gloeothece citriformis]ACK68792.1 hypothetical protein PCC7424_0324 [Gloeothece citriformis PCC 7424]